MSSREYILVDDIRENIDNLVAVQEKVVEDYKNLTRTTMEDVKNIQMGLQDEKDILNGLKNNLNLLFNIKPTWYKPGFLIRPIELHRYEIRPPLMGVNRSSNEFMLLKKTLIQAHEKHFLCDGMVCYAYSSVESHMWEIPNPIPDDAFIRKLRRTLR